MHSNYTMKPWKKVALTLMAILTILNGIWICFREDSTPRWHVDLEIPMVNSCIEWTGAGYNGIYQGGNGK